MVLANHTDETAITHMKTNEITTAALAAKPLKPCKRLVRLAVEELGENRTNIANLRHRLWGKGRMADGAHPRTGYEF